MRRPARYSPEALALVKRYGGLAALIAWVVLGLMSPVRALAADRPAPPKSPAGAEAGEPDLSSPAKALAFFVKALEKGDESALRAVVTGDEKQLEWVRAEAAQWSALRNLESALAKRYGPDYAALEKGKEAKERIAEARDADLHDDLARAKVASGKSGNAKANEAEVVLDETAPDSHQGRLVRVEGRWRFDLASLSDYMAADDVPVLKAVSVAAGDLARDVTAGKFATVDEAADAIDERLSAAVDAALPKTKSEPPPAKVAEPRRHPKPQVK